MSILNIRWLHDEYTVNIWWFTMDIMNIIYVSRYVKNRKANIMFYSPPARWGLLDFIRAVLLRLRILLLLVLLLAVQIPVGTAGPPPRAPDPSGHCRTSTASCRSQWALPDLNRELQIPVGTAGSQWALPDLNRDFQIAVGTAGPQPRLPDRSGYCRTSTGRKDVR